MYVRMWHNSFVISMLRCICRVTLQRTLV